MTLSRPNFFLLGAPKSGSTALFTYLFDHPQVFFPPLKEPRFFAEDFGAFREISDLPAYEKLYTHAPLTAQAIGDGSPWYLCSEIAIPAIRNYAPDARAIVILRNPLEMLPSLHSQFLYSFKEDETDLKRAWQLQESRSLGQNIPHAHPAPALLQYGKLTRLGDQFERLSGTWPKHRIHVILFDDFRRDTRSVYGKVLKFLELEDDGKTEFPIINDASINRNKTIGWILKSPASPYRNAIRHLRNWSGFKSTGWLAPLYDRNRMRRGKVSLDGDFREELIEYYKEDVAKLGRMIGRDLGHWLT